MKKIGVLLSGLSLLTLAMVVVFEKIAEPLFSIAHNPTYTTPILAYMLIGIVFISGVVLIIVKK